MHNIKNILHHLKRAGYSQAFIADFVGVRQSTISRLYTGKLKGVKFEVGMKLFALLNQVKNGGQKES